MWIRVAEIGGDQRRRGVFLVRECGQGVVDLRRRVGRQVDMAEHGAQAVISSQCALSVVIAPVDFDSRRRARSCDCVFSCVLHA
jgi:hypothetical protein